MGFNLENLTLTGSASYGYGNSLNNIITGNSSDNSLFGGFGDDTLDGGTGSDAMYGGAGNDVYYVDSSSDSVTEEAGTDTVYSSISSYILGDNLENLILTGSAYNGYGNIQDNVLTGNSNNNILNGAYGNDTLDGGMGSDSLIGGAGNDVYYVDSASDSVTENVAEGTDTVYSSISYSLGMNLENLTLTGSALNGNGNSQDNIISGNSFDNNLHGDSGNDTLYGGTGNDTLNGGYGNDAMYGGTGNDAYYVDSTFDSVTEYVAEGIDTVYSSISYSLGINLENLTLTDSASHGYGNSLDNILTGNIYNNSLDGGAGNDTLDGGLGSDSLSGGLGDDAYLVDSASDSVTEFIAEGTDTVYASVSYTLGINLENLVLTGTATNGYGNTLDNVLIGNIYNNILDGSTGNDALYGGVGNDVYYIDSSLDSAIENAAEGTDTVYTSLLSYSLGNNLENLTLTGTAANGNGNTLDNVITGNSGNNTLDGGYGNDTLIGGTGNDTMYGRTGNDVYYVDSYSDSVTENAAEGTDTVYSSISYTLGVNLENLTLTGTATNGYGNTLDNVITGNSYNNDLNGGEGNDTLIGYGGGLENDYLSGGYGADTFALGNSLGAFYQGGNSGNGYAIVTDYSYGQGDKIQLYGNSNYYTFTSSNYGGAAATDILISYGSDLIAMVYDTTAISYTYV